MFEFLISETNLPQKCIFRRRHMFSIKFNFKIVLVKYKILRKVNKTTKQQQKFIITKHNNLSVCLCK